MDDLEDKYIELQLEKFSVFREKFIEDTKHDDILMVMLRAHLYIEKEMVKLTEIFFKHPNMLKNYKFASRLNLLYSLGIIEKEIYDPIKKINEIRNELSHRLGYTFTEKEYKKLFDSLSGHILQEFKKDIKMIENNSEYDYVYKTKMLVSCIWTSLKASVLTPVYTKYMLANEYKEQADEELRGLLNINI